jgi:hypothetical protein
VPIKPKHFVEQKRQADCQKVVDLKINRQKMGGRLSERPDGIGNLRRLLRPPRL